MEPIKKEIIEFADDFFFRLTDAQLEEKLKEFKQRQPNIYRYMKSPEGNMRGAQQHNIFWRIMLVMDYCFSSYPVKLPTYSEAMAVQAFKDLIKESNELVKQGIHQMPVERWFEELEQEDLCIFFNEKITYYSTDEKVFDEKQVTELFYTVLFNSKSFQREVKKLMLNYIPE